MKASDRIVELQAELKKGYALSPLSDEQIYAITLSEAIMYYLDEKNGENNE